MNKWTAFAVPTFLYFAQSSTASLAQSEFLRYGKTGLGGEGLVAVGEETDHLVGVSVSLSFQGVLDFRGAVDRLWFEDSGSSSHDAQHYLAAVGIHPRKVKSNSGLQPVFGAGFTWRKPRVNSFFPDFDPDDSAPFVEVGLYGVTARAQKPALIPLLRVGRILGLDGESLTYYTA